MNLSHVLLFQLKEIAYKNSFFSLFRPFSEIDGSSNKAFDWFSLSNYALCYLCNGNIILFHENFSLEAMFCAVMSGLGHGG